MKSFIKKIKDYRCKTPMFNWRTTLSCDIEFKFYPEPYCGKATQILTRKEKKKLLKYFLDSKDNLDFIPHMVIIFGWELINFSIFFVQFLK